MKENARLSTPGTPGIPVHETIAVPVWVTARRWRALSIVGFLLVFSLPAVADDTGIEPGRESSIPFDTLMPADEILAHVSDARLRGILTEVLTRNPDLASLEAKARALDHRPTQARSLPDPHATLTTYLSTPESRVGPQRAMATLSQRFPWFGKLDLKEQAALHEAAATHASLEARRLARITEARTHYFEIAFLDSFALITRDDRETLGYFEEIARARYSSGAGLQQDVVKIQAEITKDDTRLLEIAKRRAGTAAALNALRDRPDFAEIPEIHMQSQFEIRLDHTRLQSNAVARRPEVAVADALIDRAAVDVRLARKRYNPDLTLGLTYTFVDPRDDPAGLLSPPQDDGQDVLGLTFGINLPIWRRRLSAGVNETREAQTATREQKRSTISGINRSLDDLYARIPLLWNQLRLFDDVLVRQSEESLRSVVSAYGVGSVNALDLLDAERVLLESRTAAERTRADYAIALALLEGTVAGPVSHVEQEGGITP